MLILKPLGSFSTPSIITMKLGLNGGSLMGNPIVECIPNFSEARNPEVLEEIQKAIRLVPDIHILDRHSDLDHNRTVFTFIGSPESIAEAAFQAIRRAAELIDLNTHRGEHPRIGATDVVPFVPISDISLAECIEIAKNLGKRVADELNIPVYLYEEAASVDFPERKNLENIRRGQFEKLREEIQTDPSRSPDYGPLQLGSAGATVIGARHPLIAFNVYLNTDQCEVAQKIAKAIRHSSGGFRFLKAIGLVVHGRAQVSMNFTNFSQTPLARVVEMIRREAAVYGTSIQSSELVGLIPQKALTDAAKWYLQLHQFEKQQILEQRITDALNQEKEKEDPEYHKSFLTQLAEDTPTPGGGAALAYSAAQSAALLSMVAKSTLRKKSYQKFHGLMQHILEEADATRVELIVSMEQDSDAFNHFLEVIKKTSPLAPSNSTPSAELLQAISGISHIPLMLAKKCLLLMDLAVNAAQHGNQNALADSINAYSLAKTAAEGSILNITLNTKDTINFPSIAPFADELAVLNKKISVLQLQMKGVYQFNALESITSHE